MQAIDHEMYGNHNNWVFACYNSPQKAYIFNFH